MYLCEKIFTIFCLYFILIDIGYECIAFSGIVEINLFTYSVLTSSRAATIMLSEDNCHFLRVDKDDFNRILRVSSTHLLLSPFLVCLLHLSVGYEDT